MKCAAIARPIPRVPPVTSDVDATSVPVVWLTKEAARRLQRMRERALDAAGVDAATLDLLSTLRRAGAPYALTSRELARRCLVTAGAISQRVARAERAGYVERRPLDGRSAEITLTRAGHETVEHSARRVLAADAEVSAGLDAAELAALEGLLARWIDGIPDTADGDTRA